MTIQLKNINKSYGNKTVLREITLKLEKNLRRF